MGKMWAYIGHEGGKTALMVGHHTLFTSGDSLLLHGLTLAYCVVTVLDHYRHHWGFWLQGLIFGFLSCLLLLRMALRSIHRRHMKTTG